MAHIFGVDVSKYDYGFNPDRATTTISFVIQRASYSKAKDERFDEMLPQVLKIPVRGAYHYFSSWINWKVQADFFLSVVKDKGFHFYAFDYETIFNVLDNRTIAEAVEFIKYVKAQTGKKCLFYTSPSVYNEFIKPYGYESWMKSQELWIAQYPYVANLNLDRGPSMPAGLTEWKIFQFGGADCNGTYGRTAGAEYGAARTGIDTNIASFATVAELWAWAGVTEGVPTDDDPLPPIDTTPVKSNLYVFSDVCYWNRSGGPLTNPMSRITKMGDNKMPLTWVKKWLPYFKALGNTALALSKITAVDVGPSQGLDVLKDKLKYLGLTWAGRNIVHIKTIVEGLDGQKWGEVETISENLVPDITKVNRFSCPATIHTMYGFSASTKYYSLPFSCYLPLLSTSPFYVPMNTLVSVDSMLPKTVKGISWPYLNVRETPESTLVVGRILPYTSTIILEVKIANNGIWGRNDKGWLALRFNDKNMTDWKI